jgi:rhodanese-related sulfurtransferase
MNLNFRTYQFVTSVAVRAFARRVLTEAAVILLSAMILVGAYFAVLIWRERTKIVVASTSTTQEATLRIAGRPEMVVGSRLEVDGVETSGFSLILILSPSCHFCAENAPFYRRLVRAAHETKVPLRIAVPASSATPQFMSALNLGAVPTFYWDSMSEKFRGTPTLLLWGPGGRIRRIWFGALGPTEEADVLVALRDPSHAKQPSKKLDDGEIVLTPEEVMAKGGGVVISVAEREQFERSHPAGAINIPLKELLQRADRDLSRERLVVIDCSSVMDKLCSSAIGFLRQDGFRVVPADYGGAETQDGK